MFEEKVSNQQAHVKDEVPKSEDFIPSRNHVAPEKLIKHVEDSEPEGVSELVQTNEREVVSEPLEVKEQQTEKVSPSEPTHSEDKTLELTADNKQCDVNEDLATKVEEPKPAEVTVLVSTSPGTGLATEQKQKKQRRRRKNKNLEQAQDVIPTEDLLNSGELAAKDTHVNL